MMPKESADPLSLHLDEKLTHLSGAHFEWQIYKIHDGLRKQNEKAYEPEILSIGPYHHGKGHLRMMEEQKLKYLQLLLKRTEETSVDRYVIAMKKVLKRAQGCYADPIDLSDDEFVKMMLLDSCFLIEFLRKFSMPSLIDAHDLLFKMDWMFQSLWRDLMLFENQLPFFILVQFFNMTKIPDRRDNIIDLVVRYYCCVREQYLCRMSPVTECVLNNIRGVEKRWHSINCATELYDAGIRFKKAKHTPFSDIKFANCTLYIPEIAVEENSDTIFRNLIAHEEYLADAGPKFVTDYLTFLCCLINSEKDVRLLRRCGILNMLGDDRAVSAIFTKVSSCVSVSRRSFHYYEVFNDINRYCNCRRNEWKAKLRRDYFNGPWKVISFLAAVLLLLLTLVQTFISVLDYYHQN